MLRMETDHLTIVLMYNVCYIYIYILSIFTTFLNLQKFRNDFFLSYMIVCKPASSFPAFEKLRKSDSNS